MRSSCAICFQSVFYNMGKFSSMNHPFELNLADLEAMDLDFEEQLTDRETAQIGGGEHSEIVCISAPCPGSERGDYPEPPWYGKPVRKPPFRYPKPPEATTLAIGEEGGGYDEVTTLAIGEEGGYEY